MPRTLATRGRATRVAAAAAQAAEAAFDPHPRQQTYCPNGMLRHIPPTPPVVAGHVAPVAVANDAYDEVYCFRVGGTNHDRHERRLHPGTYIPPHGDCPCTRCASLEASYVASLTHHPGLSDLFIEAEKRLSRRLSWSEYMGVIAYYSSYGPVFPRRGEDVVTCWKRWQANGPGVAAEQRTARERADRLARAKRDRRLAREERASQAANRANLATVIAAAIDSEKPWIGSKLPRDMTADPTAPTDCEVCGGDGCTMCDSDGPSDDDEFVRKSRKHGTPFLAAKGEKCKRLVGLEVEFNNMVNLSSWVDRWHGAIHQDGSCGYEAVTTPLAGGAVNACVRELMRTLRNAGARADERCGVHVHVDGGDLRWTDMRRLLKVYAKLEPFLYLLAGQQRLDQSYCRPTGIAYGKAASADDYKSAVLVHAVSDECGGTIGTTDVKKKASNIMRARPGKKNGGRYKGLNIVPWIVARRSGKPDCTLEFRMHRNSLDAGRIAGWANLLAQLVDWCSKATDAEADALPRSALRALCRVIAPESAPWIVRRVNLWRKLTTFNMPYGRPVKPGASKRRISTKGGVYSCAV